MRNSKSLETQFDKWLIVFLSIYLSLLFFLPLTFKYVVAAFLLLVFIIRYRIGSLTVAATIVALLVLPFYNPSRLTTITTISYHDFMEGIKIDYQQAYGIHLSTLFLPFALGLHVIDIIGKRKCVHRSIHLIFFMSLTSVAAHVISSYLHSPFPALSMSWAVHYWFLYATAFVVYFIIKSVSHATVYLRSVFFVILVMQIAIAMMQFLYQGPIGFPFENSMGFMFYQGIDENNAFYRVDGTFSYSNELAIIMVMLLTVLLESISLRSLVWQLPLWLATSVTLVLSQSRAAFVAFLVVSLFIIYSNWKIIRAYFNRYLSRRSVLFMLMLLLLTAPFFVPRLLLSPYFFTTDSSLTMRVNMISEAGQLLASQPPFGTGPGTNEYLLIHGIHKSVIREFVATVHNGFVSLLLEVGIIGFIIFVLPILLMLLKTLSLLIMKRGKVSDYSHLGVFALGIVVWVMYYLVHPHVGIVEYPFIGIVVGYGLYGLEKIKS
jgi:hypothetical protein